MSYCKDHSDAKSAPTSAPGWAPDTYLLQFGYPPARRRAAPDRRADVRPARGATLTTTGAALRSLWCRRRQPAPCH
jgi:hypothetical protein